LRRRECLMGLGAGGAAALLPVSRDAHAFADSGAFHPRLLEGGSAAEVELDKQALGRWSYELMARTSAPARLAVDVVDPASAALLNEPLLIWAGAGDPADLSKGATRRLREFLGLGGTLIVDGRGEGARAFLAGVKRQLGRIVPEAAPVTLPKSHVLCARQDDAGHLARVRPTRGAGPRSRRTRLCLSNHAGRQCAAGAGRPFRRQPGHVRAVFGLQGRSGARALLDAPSSAESLRPA
jgi:hypothetical protein